MTNLDVRQKLNPSPMCFWPFDVNDEDNRNNFLYRHFLSLLGDLTEQHRPIWGKLTAIQMVEHLTETFDLSLGKGEDEFPMTAELVKKRRKFLYNNFPTPHEVANPLMDEKQCAFKFNRLDEAKKALSVSVIKFRAQKDADPAAIHFHPIFGYLNMKDWERAHYKHCYHHLLQFGLIKSTG